MTKTALILGASGKFGAHCSTAFKADGWTVRHYDRKTDDMTKAAMGADVIVNGLNPPNYHNWAENLPRITTQVIAAAKASGATVIIPGNVYVFGNAPGSWDENTPHRPNTRKGQLRKELEETYRKAALDGVQTITLRAGDVIDPEAADTMMGIVMFSKLNKGKISVMGRTDIPHAWCYVPDFARAAVALANKRGELAIYEDIPFPGQTFSADDIKATIEGLMGRDLRTTHFQWWLLKLASPIWELARELLEMRYLWDVPHELAGEKFFRLLPDFALTTNRVALANALPKDVNPDKTVVRSGAAIKAH